MGTATAVGSSSTEPSKLLAYAADGQLLREYTVQGQVTSSPYGTVGMAFDGDGLLYVVDRSPPRVFRLDPETGAQSDYARIRDVLPCSQGGAPGDCSATVGNLGSFADYPVFAEGGTLYVTDLWQALIWRIPRGGGEAEVWFTDARLEGVLGPNGIQFQADGETLLFAQTASMTSGGPSWSSTGTGVASAIQVREGTRRIGETSGHSRSDKARYVNVPLAGCDGGIRSALPLHNVASLQRRSRVGWITFSRRGFRSSGAWL